MPVPADGIEILLLAAGGGTRLGGGKLLLPWRDKPILFHTLDTILAMRETHPITVVLGHEAERVAQAIEEAFGASPPFRIVENTAWREGMSTSLRLGFSKILERSASGAIAGVMIVLGDQPLVRTETLDSLAMKHAEARASNPTHPATAPAHAGRRGNPVVLSPPLYPKIRELTGDIGARNILAGLGDSLLTVPVDDPGIVNDIDTRSEYDALM